MDVATQQVNYTYDAMGRRLSKAIDWDCAGSGTATTTHFVYDRDNVLLEFTNNALSQRYLHGTRVDQVLAQESGSGETIWHLTDHLGTVRDLVDERGEVVNHLKYDSFGQIVSQTNEVIGSRYQFTGREFDAETGLHYYRARYYDANVGRFISEDPIGFRAGDTNIYRYVSNDPIGAIDPSGKFRIEFRYRQAFLIPVFHHTDIVVSDRNGMRAYWARGERNGRSESIFGNIVADQETRRLELGGYGPGFVFYVNDPRRIQLIYDDESDCPDPYLENQIKNEFLRIQAARIPYAPFGRNSNSAAFQVIRNVLGMNHRPIDSVNPVRWNIDSFTGRDVSGFIDPRETQAFMPNLSIND